MTIFYCLLVVYLIFIVVHSAIRSNDIEPEYSKDKYEKFRSICVVEGFLPFDYVEKVVANVEDNIEDNVDTTVKQVDYFQKMDKNGNTLFADTRTGYVVLETQTEIKIINKI